MTQGFIHLPLIRTVRDLLNEPRGMDRFSSYLKKMLNSQGEVVLPIHGFNPMSKEHVAQILDQLITIEAETIFVQILSEVFIKLSWKPSVPWKTGLVLSDDLKGGWTNRPSIQLERWTNPQKLVWRDFMPLIWWVTDSIDRQTLELGLKRQLFEVHWLLEGNQVGSLLEILKLRRNSLLFASAGARGDSPQSEESFTRLIPYLDATDVATLIACLFGDEAAIQLGHPALGIRPNDAESALPSTGLLNRI